MAEVLALEEVYDRLQSYTQSSHGWEYTAPFPGVFDSHFAWDSALHGIAWSYKDPPRAASEIMGLFAAQWSNNFIPNQILPSSAPYAEKWFLGSYRNPDAPNHLHTSGVTQPPLFIDALWEIGQNMSAPERLAFFEAALPPSVAFLEYLFDQQVINDDGLIALKHPYESGTDNAPHWLVTVMEAWEAQEDTWAHRLKHKFGGFILNIVRRDIKHAPIDERMQNGEVLAYAALTLRLRKRRYDMQAIIDDEKIPLIEDVGFNSILARACHTVENIAEQLNVELPDKLQESINKLEKGLENLWDEKDGCYFSRNARTKELIKIETAAGLLPLFAGCISNERAQKLIKRAQDPRKYWTEYPIPSVPIDSPYFNANRYWLGGRWPMMMYALVEGLRNYGANEAAERIIDSILQSAPAEYTNTFTGQGLGVPNFGPALALHAIYLQRKAKALY